WSVIFLFLILIVGKKAGIKAILSLGGSVALIFFVLLPMIKNGWSPVPITVLGTAVIILFTHLLITGVGKKSWAAMGGTLGGVISAVLLIYLIGYFSNLTGLGTEDSRILAINYPDFNFRGLLFSGIILGALGAVMDTAISISSGLSEIKEHKTNISRKRLFKSGMNIGRDIMGSMLNTLIFAYIGASLVSIILYYLLKTSVIELLNYGFIAEEIARSLVGSMGLLLTIPLTAGLSSLLMGKK
ncbi:YibE/F family protein, partial [Candidatus Peregrinibacteria bacterium]|nr:YibE/F family protein [Candidatus Peregrinibacteria bacterium]